VTRTAQQTILRSISEKRARIAALREELEDLHDYLDLTEARMRDEGKPRLTRAEVKKRYAVKSLAEAVRR
jgi:LytS/YehU family sensor histidine kinase